MNNASFFPLRAGSAGAYLPWTCAHTRACRWQSSKGARGRKGRKQGGKVSQSSAAWLDRQARDQYAKRAREEGSPSRAMYKLEQIDKMFRRQQQQQQQLKNTKKNRGGLFSRGDAVIDLGAAPGGWCMHAARQIGSTGKLIAVDLLPLDGRTMTELERDENMADFCSIQGDFNSSQVKGYIAAVLRDGTKNASFDDFQQDGLLKYRADVILSDMAANFTGDKRTDALRTMTLCENALMFSAGATCFDPEVSETVEEVNRSNITWQHIGLLRLGGSFLCKFFQCGRDNEKELLDAAGRLFTEATVIKPKASRKESAEQYLLATGYQGTPLLRSILEPDRAMQL